MEFLKWYLELVKTNGFLGLLVLCALYYLIKYTFRSIRIIARGWPPLHCDVDGDFKKDKEQEACK